AGMACDRLGHKRLALAGLGVMATGGFLGAAAHGFALLLLSRFVEGVGFILFAVPAPALMTAMTASARDRAKALGIWSAYMPTGGAIALVAASPLIAASGWRGMWLVLAAAALAAVVPFASAVPASRPAQLGSLRLVAESLRRKGNLAMALLFACYVAQWTSVMVWLPTFLSEQGLAPAAAATATALMVLVNAPGNLLGGWLLSRGVPRGGLVVAASLTAAACEAGMFLPQLPGAARFGLVLAFSLCAGTIPASIFAGLPVHARSPQHIATGNGMVLQFSNLGQFLGPLLVAWLASRLGGWQASLWALLAFAAGAAACGAALAVIEKRRR
ncbi:MAG TPA: MFS transporter, partial [Burkholderiales bacterium]|nr:MFS transporter [Burkholderiales bacterium]